MTLGVRGACIDAEGRVFLVRHSYMAGWYLPGGGVERGETMIGALGRELREEGGILLEGEAELFGIYFNQKRKIDHVALYVCRSFSRPDPPRYPNREIAEAAFFAPDALPAELSPATRRRLGELLDGSAIEAMW
jgi:8-oxo-dGTP pyrophosphatase MutT (NUDIX family)